MRIDPGGWTLGLTGCFVDWLITRQWRRIMLGFIPVFVALTVGGLVAWGSRVDRNRLAERYMDLANLEVKAWEDQWSPASADGNSAASTVDAPAGADRTADANSPAEIPAFAETLFRRVQQLQSGDQRSAFFIAMTLAQRGSLQLALSRLEKLAPIQREGYAPAHAVLAQALLSAPISSQNLAIVKHHARVALRAQIGSARLLAQISELFWATGDRSLAIDALTLAAQRDSKYFLMLAKLTSEDDKWKLQREQALAKAESHFRQLVESNPLDAEARGLLADVLLLKGDSAAAEQLTLDGLKIEDQPILRRKLSDIYIVQFLSTNQITETSWTGDIQLLERAQRIDPTNEKVFEQVAKLARVGGEIPSKELETQLHQLLAKGTATSATHMWIAEYYLVHDQMAKAVPHLEQAVLRDPRAFRCRNNLAYCLASLYPDRLEEALTHIDRAIELVGNVAEFYDTRGTVLVAMGRHKESIEAFERAVELVATEPRLNPPNPGYHERLAASYKAIGQDAIAQEHQRIADDYHRQAKDQAEAKAASEAVLDAPEPS